MQSGEPKRRDANVDGLRPELCPALPSRRAFALRRLRSPSAVWILCVLSLTQSTGCATFGRRTPVPDEIAECRDLSRQGVAALEMGNWGEAEMLLRKAMQSSPNDPETRRYLAEALWHRGAADEALREIEAAVGMDPDDAALHVRAGEMLLAVGDVQPALRHAEQAIGNDSQLGSAWVLRGRVYWQMNDLERALADLQRGLQYAPNNPEVLLDLAALYRQRGEPARTLTVIHHLLDSYPPGEEPQLALLLEGLALVDLGRTGQGIESLTTANQRGPRNAEILFRLAQAQLANGDPIAASDTAQQALAIDATHEQCRQLVAQLAHATASGATSRR